MIADKPSAKFEIISDMIGNPQNTMTVSELCKIAGVSRSGYYRWVDVAPAREKREAADRADFALVLAAYQKHGYAKGARGMRMTFPYWVLSDVGIPITISRWLRKYWLSVKPFSF